MPFVTIKLIADDGNPTPEQKAELMKGATELLARVLGKNPAATHVVIEEVSAENWSVGGVSVAQTRRNKAEAQK